MTSLKKNRVLGDQQIALHLGRGCDELLICHPSISSFLALMKDILNQLSALNIIENCDGNLFSVAQEDELFRDAWSSNVAKKRDWFICTICQKLRIDFNNIKTLYSHYYHWSCIIKLLEKNFLKNDSFFFILLHLTITNEWVISVFIAWDFLGPTLFQWVEEKAIERNNSD